MIGDIVGEECLDFIADCIQSVKQIHEVHFCIANAENSHQGKGTNDQIVNSLFKRGVHVITGGDHSFDKHLVFPLMEKEPRLLRPYNYPEGVVGYGYGVYAVPNTDYEIGVINLRGQVFFQNPIRCPFRTAEHVLAEIKERTPMVVIDFHAEATAEKWSFARYLDGKVSAIAGTHTHVQTADEQILPSGTGYITDIGFTGPYNSVIGMDSDTSIRRFLYQTPQKYKMAELHFKFHAVLFELDSDTGLCFSVRRIIMPPHKTSILDL